MHCPYCSVALGGRHLVGYGWERCPCCGEHLETCHPLQESPPRPVPFSRHRGSSWLDACREFGFFEKKVAGVWVPCDAEDPDSQPDVNRLIHHCYWNRYHKRFQRRRKKSAR